MGRVRAGGVARYGGFLLRPVPESLRRCRCRCVRLDESLCTSQNRSHKRNRHQDRTVDLFRLGNREQEPFPGFFESRTLEHNDAVGSGAGRESTRCYPVLFDRNRLGLDRLSMLVFRCPRKLYLRRQYFNSPCRRGQNGERHGHLLLFHYRLSYRYLKLLSFPGWLLNAFCPAQMPLWSSSLLRGTSRWL